VDRTSQFVVFRSAKELPFAERKATFSRGSTPAISIDDLPLPEPPTIISKRGSPWLRI
jgi:hypothetical protein